MPQLVFVNLPVSDLPRSVGFYESIGAARNPAFSDDTAACMVLSETIFVMLLTHAKFATFTPKPIADAHATCQVLLALSRDGRAEVDSFVEAGAAAGGRADPRAPQDHGFMYGRALEDPDGHCWEAIWMDMAAAAPPADSAA